MPKKALVVDDSPTMRQMVTDTLRSAGYGVVACCNGQDALDRISDQRFDLVITDFNMPVMGGMALVRELRSRFAFRFIPILVLTTEAGDEEKRTGRAAGATGWVVKPFDPDRFVQVVNRLVP